MIWNALRLKIGLPVGCFWKFLTVKMIKFFMCQSFKPRCRRTAGTGIFLSAFLGGMFRINDQISIGCVEGAEFPDTKFLLPYGRQSTVVSRYGHRNRMGLEQVLLPVFAGKSPAHPLAGPQRRHKRCGGLFLAYSLERTNGHIGHQTALKQPLCSLTSPPFPNGFYYGFSAGSDSSKC